MLPSPHPTQLHRHQKQPCMFAPAASAASPEQLLEAESGTSTPLESDGPSAGVSAAHDFVNLWQSGACDGAAHEHLRSILARTDLSGRLTHGNADQPNFGPHGLLSSDPWKRLSWVRCTRDFVMRSLLWRGMLLWYQLGGVAASHLPLPHLRRARHFPTFAELCTCGRSHHQNEASHTHTNLRPRERGFTHQRNVERAQTLEFRPLTSRYQLVDIPLPI
jgi:hypothetical protein